MKRFIGSLVLTGLLCGGVALAQQAGSAPATTDAGAGEHGGRHGDPDMRLAHMTQRYNLTADQQGQIKPLLQDGQQKMEALRADGSLSREDKIAKFHSLREEQSQKISAVLTDEQRKKFDADQQRREEHHAGHEHGHEAGATPPQN